MQPIHSFVASLQPISSSNSSIQPSTTYQNDGEIPFFTLLPEDYFLHLVVDVLHLASKEGKWLEEVEQRIQPLALTQEQVDRIEAYLKQNLLLKGKREGCELNIPYQLWELHQVKKAAMKELEPYETGHVRICGSRLMQLLGVEQLQQMFEQLLRKTQNVRTDITADQLITPYARQKMQEHPNDDDYHYRLASPSEEAYEKVHEKVIEYLTQRLPLESIDRRKVSDYLNKLKQKVIQGRIKSLYIKQLIADRTIDTDQADLLKLLIKIDAFYLVKRITKGSNDFVIRSCKAINQEEFSKKNRLENGQAKFKEHKFDLVDLVKTSRPYKIPSDSLRLYLDPLLENKKGALVPFSSTGHLMQTFGDFNARIVTSIPGQKIEKIDWVSLISSDTKAGRCLEEGLEELYLEVIVNQAQAESTSIASFIFEMLRSDAISHFKEPSSALVSLCYRACLSLKLKGNTYIDEIQELWQLCLDCIDTLWPDHIRPPLIEQMKMLMRDPHVSFDDLHAIIHLACYLAVNAQPDALIHTQYAVYPTQSRGKQPHLQLRIFLTKQDKQDSNNQFLTLLFPLFSDHPIQGFYTKLKQTLYLEIASHLHFKANASSLTPYAHFAPLELDHFFEMAFKYLEAEEELEINNSLGISLLSACLAQKFSLPHICHYLFSTLSVSKPYDCVQEFLKSLSILIKGTSFEGIFDAQFFQAWQKRFSSNSSIENQYSFLLNVIANREIAKFSFPLLERLMLEANTGHMQRYIRPALKILFKHQLFEELFKIATKLNASFALAAEDKLTLLIDLGVSLTHVNSPVQDLLEQHVCFETLLLLQNLNNSFIDSRLRLGLLTLLESLWKRTSSVSIFQLFSLALQKDLIPKDAKTAQLWAHCCTHFSTHNSFYLFNSFKIGFEYSLWNFLSENSQRKLTEIFVAYSKEESRFSTPELVGYLQQLRSHSNLDQFSLLKVAFKETFQELFIAKVQVCSTLALWLDMHALLNLNHRELDNHQTLQNILFEKLSLVTLPHQIHSMNEHNQLSIVFKQYLSSDFCEMNVIGNLIEHFLHNHLHYRAIAYQLLYKAFELLLNKKEKRYSDFKVMLALFDLGEAFWKEVPYELQSLIGAHLDAIYALLSGLNQTNKSLQLLNLGFNLNWQMQITPSFANQLLSDLLNDAMLFEALILDGTLSSQIVECIFVPHITDKTGLRTFYHRLAQAYVSINWVEAIKWWRYENELEADNSVILNLFQATEALIDLNQISLVRQTVFYLFNKTHIFDLIDHRVCTKWFDKLLDHGQVDFLAKLLIEFTCLRNHLDVSTLHKVFKQLLLPCEALYENDKKIRDKFNILRLKYALTLLKATQDAYPPNWIKLYRLLKVCQDVELKSQALQLLIRTRGQLFFKDQEIALCWKYILAGLEKSSLEVFYELWKDLKEYLKLFEGNHLKSIKKSVVSSVLTGLLNHLKHCKLNVRQEKTAQATKMIEEIKLFDQLAEVSAFKFFISLAEICMMAGKEEFEHVCYLLQGTLLGFNLTLKQEEHFIRVFHYFLRRIEEINQHDYEQLWSLAYVIENQIPERMDSLLILKTLRLKENYEDINIEHQLHFVYDLIVQHAKYKPHQLEVKSLILTVLNEFVNRWRLTHKTLFDSVELFLACIKHPEIKNLFANDLDKITEYKKYIGIAEHTYKQHDSLHRRVVKHIKVYRRALERHLVHNHYNKTQANIFEFRPLKVELATFEVLEHAQRVVIRCIAVLAFAVLSGISYYYLSKKRD